MPVWNPGGGSGSGSGNVAGPASAVDGNVAVYDGTTGKLIKDSGIAPGGAADASTTVKGVSKTSVAPAVAASPIAVGDNDIRVTADQIAAQASIRTLGSGAQQAAGGTHSHTISLDTDPTLAANSDAVIASQKAIKSYVDNPLIIDAKGDLLVGTADNTIARKAVGANGTVVTADSAQSDGLAYAAPGGIFVNALEGVLAENFPIRLISINPGNLRPVSGRLDSVKIPVPQTITATNILLLVNQVGVTLTSGQNKVALLTSAGVKIGETADQSTTWPSTGEPTIMPIAGVQIVIPGGPGVFIRAVVLSVGSTTVGLRGIAAAGSVVQVPNKLLAVTDMWYAVAGGLAGQTSIPTPITMPNNTDSNLAYWIGLS